MLCCPTPQRAAAAGPRPERRADIARMQRTILLLLNLNPLVVYRAPLHVLLPRPSPAAAAGALGPNADNDAVDGHVLLRFAGEGATNTAAGMLQQRQH